MDRVRHFYCSYCLLTGVSPSTTTRDWNNGIGHVYDGTTSLEKAMAPLLADRDKHVVEVIVQGRDPLKVADEIVSLFRQSNCYHLDVRFYPGYISLTVNNGTIGVFQRVKVNFYPMATPELTLIARPDYGSQIMRCENTEVSTLCAKGCKESRGWMVYFLEPDAIISEMTVEDLVEFRLGSNSPFRRRSDAEMDNMRKEAERAFIPKGSYHINPYTHHGSEIPMEYRRIWSFLHCCRNNSDTIVPECLLGYLCRRILDIYFWQAEAVLSM